MSKYWEEHSEMVDTEDYQAWLDEYKEDDIIERELEERKGIKNEP